MLKDKNNQLSIYSILYNKIPKNHTEAKQTMKEYLESQIQIFENIIDPEIQSKTLELIENAKEILDDPKFIEQRGVRSIIDQEARVGHKTKTDHFFGYKTEFAMTTDE